MTACPRCGASDWLGHAVKEHEAVLDLLADWVTRADAALADEGRPPWGPGVEPPAWDEQLVMWAYDRLGRDPSAYPHQWGMR